MRTKLIIATTLALALGFGWFCYISRVSERRWGLVEGRRALKSAAMDFAEHGYLRTTNGWNKGVWLSSNSVSISGTQYQCQFITTNHWLCDEGALALTTNGELIWLDSKLPPKLVGADYRPPIFPSRF